MVLHLETADADASTASETDALAQGSPGAVGAAVPRERRPWGRPALACAAALAAALAASSVASSLSRGAAGSQPRGPAEPISGEEPISFFARSGCENWRDIAIGAVVPNQTEGSCGDLCRRTPDCHMFNLQVGECGHNCSVGPGACYLFGKGCKREVNTCWDLHSAQGPPSFFLDPAHSRKGCANWDAIKLQNATRVRSLYDCAQLCSRYEARGCAQFNFQPGPCAGRERIDEGFCYLFRAGCEVEDNECWDLYTHINANDLGAYTLATGVADKSATELSVESTTGFEVGSTVTVVSGKWGALNLTVSNVSAASRSLVAGTLAFCAPGLCMRVEAGDCVLSIRSFQPSGPNLPDCALTAAPMAAPMAAPTAAPTAVPTAPPTAAPTAAPTRAPMAAPTAFPTAAPTAVPTAPPTAAPTAAPTRAPTAAATAFPTAAPTAVPTAPPTPSPTPVPPA